MGRAKHFYESVFDTTITVMDLGALQMGIFPHKENGVALCKYEAYVPSKNGVLVYLNADPDLNTALNKIESAGGKILRAKTQISPEHGYMALFIDSEGNRLALASMQ